MQYNRLGRSGLKVSRLCLGCMSYGVPERGPHPWSLPLDEALAATGLQLSPEEIARLEAPYQPHPVLGFK